MDAHRHRLPIVATLVAAGIASALAADGTEAASLINKNLRRNGRHLQDGTEVVVPLLTTTGGLSKCRGDW